jgi:uncharacterized membrane protein YhaH (DUF805 family)
MIYFALLIAWLWLFFIMYVASMNMIRAHDEKKLNGWLWALCLPFVIVSLVVDFINNLIVFTLIYFELPKEWTVTDRLKRHAKQQTFRGKLSRWIAETLLNPFDHTGNHID